MDVSEKFVSEFNKLKTNCVASGQEAPKFETQLVADHIVRIGITVHLPNQDKERYFFSEISSSDLGNLGDAYGSLLECVNFAWDRLAVKGKDE